VGADELEQHHVVCIAQADNSNALLPPALTRSVILNRAYSKIEDGPGLMGDTSDHKGGGLLNIFFFFCRKQSLISL
jgi:hypothetical protein